MEKLFADWLNDNLNERAWNQNDLVQRSGLSQGAVSKVLSGLRNPGLDFCAGMAKAFHLPVEVVLEKAGYIKPKPKGDRELEEINFKISQLPPDKQQAIKEMVDFYLTKADQEARTVLNGKGVHQH